MLLLLFCAPLSTETSAPATRAIAVGGAACARASIGHTKIIDAIKSMSFTLSAGKTARALHGDEV
jgi:hypothetical protein